VSDPLLAKSGRTIVPEITLVGHTRCVLLAVEALFGTADRPTRLARSWLAFFGLGPDDFPRFLRHLRVAAAAHDWGKANDGFQGAVGNDAVTGGPLTQAIRHEHLSGLLLSGALREGAVSEWFEAAGLDSGVILTAILSHHVQASAKALGELLINDRSSFVLLSHSDDFASIWRSIQEEVGSPSPAEVRFSGRWNREDVAGKGERMTKTLVALKKQLRGDRGRNRWVMAVRAGLIVADALGSAVVRMDQAEADSPITAWAGRCFGDILTGSEVWDKVVLKRVGDLRTRGRWNDSQGIPFDGEGGFSQFQCEVATCGPRVLLTAPCGSGKTLAAWNWIKRRLDESPAARVLFLYPTRATATEGFRDYVSWAPGDEAGLLTGSAAYDLQGLFATPNDERDERDYRTDPRLFALGNWSKRVISATADQFFPFLQYEYGPLCHLPMLVESVLVVDEVHSFDASMFSTLKSFLNEFPSIPVLCMTATLSVERRRDLVEDCGLRAYPDKLPADLESIAEAARYRIEWVDRDAATGIALEALRARERVLWVANRVSACQADFTELAGRAGPGVPASCYHSRFKLEDRRARHNELIRGFQAAASDRAAGPILGVTTQVCEMSLDIDASVLITDLAPIAALIQRMGRCNRDSGKLKSRPPGRVYVIRPEPGTEKPYEKDELEAAEKFVDSLVKEHPVASQLDLEHTYEAHDPRVVEPLKHCPFLSSGPYADGRESNFRDIDEFTVPCVLEDELPDVVRAIQDRRPIDGFLVPVPRRFARPPEPTPHERFPRWLSVAPPSHYSEQIGFADRPLTSAEGA